MNHYQVLIQKLDEFIRKYYKNQVIRGLLYSIGLVVGFYLVVVALEYFGRFNSVTRGILFISLITGAALILGKWVILPLLKLMRLGKIISHVEASRIIGKHFSDVEDKLLNTLQLKSQQQQTSGFERSLIEASINQRIDELKPIPFTSAIDLRKNRKYLKYALPSLIALLFVIIVSPGILREGTERIVNFDQEFVPEAPFQFSILNNSLQALQEEDFPLKVHVKGAVLPNDVYIELEGTRIKLEKKDKLNFGYVFRSLQQDQPFRLFADGFYSEPYTLEVLAKPALAGIVIDVEYPAYLNRPAEKILNQGDLTVPQGAVLKWTLTAKNADQLVFITNNTEQVAGKDGRFSIKKRLMQDLPYGIYLENNKAIVPDTLFYRVSVIADQYPDIQVDERKDSVSARLFYFNGSIKDDYGFSRLTFNYRLKESGEAPYQVVPINISNAATAQQFFYVWNLMEMQLKPGDEISYFFEVSDNDGVNGKKSTRSVVKSLQIPTEEQLEKQQEASSQAIKSGLNESIKEARALQKDLQQLQKNLLNDKNLDWKDKKNIKDLLERQKELEKSVNQLQQQNEIKNFQQSEFDAQQNQEILDKQEQLEKLFEQLMTPEMKDLYRQLEELIEKVDRDKLMEKLQDLQMKNQDVEKELDRTLELFKQMEFDQKLTESIEKLKEMSAEQQKLAEETPAGKDDQSEQQKQEELNKSFEKLSEDLKELDKKADELKNGMDMEKTKSAEEEIKKEQQQASEQLQKNNQKKASENQKKSAEKMDQMAQQLEQMQQEGQSQQMEEDMDALRQLLENLIKLSFDQEQVMENLKKVSVNDPKYVNYIQQQKKYKDDAKIIKDSLFALSKRIAQLEATVNREIGSINRNMDKAISYLAERQTSPATANQQYVMTSLNNLANILDEALKQLQQAMANSKPGNGSCSKPGQGKPNPSLSKMQEQLAKQLDKMKKEMEKGQQPGQKGEQKGKPGGQQGMSEQLAKMAAQQAAIRRELEKMAQELNKEGKGQGNQLKDIARQMEENEKDIVNKKIKPETIRRQQEIMTRLLEHEKAQREREFDNKRESEQPKTYPVSNPQSYFEYQKKKESEIEMLKTVPVGLKPYYKRKTERYFQALKSL